MKKLFPGIVAMLMCFGFVAACGDNGGNTSSSTPGTSSEDSSSNSSVTVDPHEATLNDVKSYVHEQLIKKNFETRNDFTLINSFSFIGEDVKYDISWSVNVTEGVTIVEGETEDTVVIGELAEDLPFVLTGTISDPEGCHSVQFTLDGLALKALSVIPEAITAAPVEGVAYKYHVYQSTLAKDMYFAGSMDGYYFKTTELSDEAVDVYVEYVAGSTTEFYPYFMHAEDGKQYLGVKLSDDGAHDNIVYASSPVTVFVWNAELGTITTHLDKNKNGEAADYYFGNYSTHKTISASMLSYAGGAGNNVGHLVTLVDKNSMTADKKVAEEKEKLTSIPTEVVGEKSVELIAKGNTYADVAITWEVSGDNAVIENGVLKLTTPATADATVTLTATFTCGDVTDTKVFSILLKKYELPAANSEISIPKALEIGETLKGNTADKYYVSGTVTEVANTQYGNLYIEDANGNKIYVYGIYDATGVNRYDAMENAPQVGDTVKLYSIVSYHSSAGAQLKNAWVVESSSNTQAPEDSSSNTESPSAPEDSSSEETPAQVVSVKMNAVSFGVETDKYTYDEISATIGGTQFSAIQIGNYPADGLLRFRTKDGSHGAIWNTTAFAGKITKLVFTMNPNKSAYDGNAYVLKLGNTPACDEKTIDLATTADSTWTIEITGSYTYFKIEHNNTYTQYWDSLEVFYVSNGEVPPVDSSSSEDIPPVDSSSSEDVPPVDSSSEETPVAPTTPVEIVNALYALADGESLTGPFTVTGVITALDSYNNPTIVVEGMTDKPVYCYKLKDDSFVVGATITVTAGSMKNYMGTYEFMECTLDSIVLPSTPAPDDSSSEDVPPVDSSSEDVPPAGGDSSEETPAMTPADIVNAAYSLAENTALDGTYTLTGVISYVDSAYSAQYSNVTVVMIVEGMTDKPIMCYRMKGTGADVIGKADVITVTGTLKNYNGKVEFDTGCSLDSYTLHVCSEYTEATCAKPETCVDCDEAKNDVLAGHTFVDGACSVCGAPEGNVETITASKTMAELIVSEGWTSSTTKQEFALDDVVTVKVNGGSNTGKAYNGDHIRIYATDTPAGTLTITLEDGYELVSIKVTTATGTYAFLCVDGSDADICNATTPVSGSSVVLNSVKNGSDGKQVRVLAIEVVYVKK